MSEADPGPQQPDDRQDAAPRPAVPYLLQYTSRPPPPRDDALMDLMHAVAGAGLYLSLLVVMKLVSLRFRWDIGGVCGTWAALLILSLGVSGWLAGAHGWRGALIGVGLAAVASLFFSAVILKG